LAKNKKGASGAARKALIKAGRGGKLGVHGVTKKVWRGAMAESQTPVQAGEKSKNVHRAVGGMGGSEVKAVGVTHTSLKGACADNKS